MGWGGDIREEWPRVIERRPRNGQGVSKQYVKMKRILRSKLAQDRVRDFILLEAVRQMM